MARKPQKGRSSSAPSRKRSEYAKAAKQTDGSRFVIVTQNNVEPEFPLGGRVSSTANVPALSALLSSDMFKKLVDMYDEFRIRSLRVKIVPQANQVSSTMAGNVSLETAFDRNGRLAVPLQAQGPNGDFAYWMEGASPVATYSSYQARQLLAYTNVAQMRTLAPAGATENFYMPTSYCRFLADLPDTTESYEVYAGGYQVGLAPYGFRPILIVGATSSTPAATKVPIPVRLEWTFDISVRGLRKAQ